MFGVLYGKKFGSEISEPYLFPYNTPNMCPV